MKGSETLAKKGRTTVYNSITSETTTSQINPENIELMEDFLDYLQSIDRSKETIKSYRSDLLIFFTIVLDKLNNKSFIDITKREFARLQSYFINDLGWSSCRVRRVKSTISSMSNFITDILDEEEKYQDFKKTINRVESPVKEAVREKTILSDEQVDFLLDTLVEKKKYQVACAVALAIFSGARKSELTRFKVEYFDEENIIFDALYKTSEKIKTKGRGKGKFIYKYVLLDFKKYFDLWMAERERLGIDSEWLLVSKVTDKNGVHYEQAGITLLDSYAETCSRILGIPFYFHSMRHNLVSRLSKYNIPSNIIVEFVGWSKEGGSAMIGIYDDNEAVDDFGKYFTSDGIVKQEEKSLSDLK